MPSTITTRPAPTRKRDRLPATIGPVEAKILADIDAAEARMAFSKRTPADDLDPDWHADYFAA